MKPWSFNDIEHRILRQLSLRLGLVWGLFAVVLGLFWLAGLDLLPFGSDPRVLGLRIGLSAGFLGALALAIHLVYVFVQKSFATNLRENSRYLKSLEYLDQATGLPNGKKLMFELKNRTARSTGAITLVLAGVYLDGLDELNEARGYESTNRWLRQFARDLGANLESRLALAGLAQQEIQLFRVEGPLFMFHLNVDAHNPCALPALPGLLEHATRVTVSRDSQSLGVGFRGAYSVFEQDASTADELFRTVLHPLHSRQPGHRHRFQPFDSRLFQLFLQEEHIRELLNRNETLSQIRAVFQPKIHAPTGTCRGFEALARWTSPILGEVSPGVFIPLAERGEAIEAVTVRMLEEVQAFLKHSDAAGLGNFRVSFNLSPALVEPAFLDWLTRWIQERDLGSRLEVEITEGILLRVHDELLQSMSRLKALGLTFSIDDFGTGYSNLSYLQNFEADVIKIDKGFVDRLPHNQKTVNLLKAIISMAGSFGMGTVAEGAETPDQARMLNQLGIGEIQGYVYARPLEVEDALAFCARGAPELENLSDHNIFSDQTADTSRAGLTAACPDLDEVLSPGAV